MIISDHQKQLDYAAACAYYEAGRAVMFAGLAQSYSDITANIDRTFRPAFAHGMTSDYGTPEERDAKLRDCGFEIV